MDSTPIKIAKALNENYQNLLRYANRIKNDLIAHCKNPLYAHLLVGKFDDDDVVITLPLLRKTLTSHQRIALDSTLSPVVVISFNDEIDRLIMRLTLNIQGEVWLAEESTEFAESFDSAHLASTLTDLLISSLYKQRLINC